MPQQNDEGRPVSTSARNHIESLLPGTTFPEKPIETQTDSATALQAQPVSTEGPIINDRPTTITHFSPDQLEKSYLLPALEKLIKEAFWLQKTRDGFRPVPTQRLAYDGQLIDELRSSSETFTYVIWYTDTKQVIGTGGAKRWNGYMAVVDASYYKNFGNTWKRIGPLPDDTDCWELTVMAVDPKLQRQGLAGRLIRLVEDEVSRRFREAGGVRQGRKLLMHCTTIKEVHEAYYVKRGYLKNYEVPFEKGYYDSPCGFTVLHMSKPLEVE